MRAWLLWLLVLNLALQLPWAFHHGFYLPRMFVPVGELLALLAEVATAALYLLWLDLPPRVHPWVWLLVPTLGAVVLGLVGHLLSRGIRRQAPAASLGLLGEA